MFVQQTSMYCYPLSLSLKGIIMPPQGDSNLLGNPSLLLMGVVVKGEGDGSIPRSLQHGVLQPPLVSAVLPLREVRGAVRALRRGPDLVAIHAAATLDPGRGSARSVQGSSTCLAYGLFKNAAQ